MYIDGQKKTSFSNYFTILKVGRGHKMIKRTLRITNFTSTLCVWKGKSSISVQFFITTNLLTCEKFVNIYIFFYSWGAIEKLFENSKTIKTLGLRPRAFNSFLVFGTRVLFISSFFHEKLFFPKFELLNSGWGLSASFNGTSSHQELLNTPMRWSA